MSRSLLCASIILACLLTQGCIGTVVGAATDTAIAVAKIPFKVAGAVIDGLSSSNEDEDS